MCLSKSKQDSVLQKGDLLDDIRASLTGEIKKCVLSHWGMLGSDMKLNLLPLTSPPQMSVDFDTAITAPSKSVQLKDKLAVWLHFDVLLSS